MVFKVFKRELKLLERCFSSCNSTVLLTFKTRDKNGNSKISWRNFKSLPSDNDWIAFGAKNQSINNRWKHRKIVKLVKKYPTTESQYDTSTWGTSTELEDCYRKSRASPNYFWNECQFSQNQLKYCQRSLPRHRHLQFNKNTFNNAKWATGDTISQSTNLRSYSTGVTR